MSLRSRRRSPSANLSEKSLELVPSVTVQQVARPEGSLRPRGRSMRSRRVWRLGAVALAFGMLGVVSCGSKSAKGSSATKALADIAPTELHTVATGTSNRHFIEQW